MEVLVTEEKKKIFRARKTMKISDRQQLESLHGTLLTAAPGLSNPSPPPIMNGTHKEDGQKAGEKENNVSGSNSPHAQSPSSLTSLSSPAPFLSLNLSPSPPSSHSPKGPDDSSPPASPFHSLNFELNPDGEEKNECLPSSSKDSASPARTECKEEKDARAAAAAAAAGEQKDKTTAPLEQAADSEKDSAKGSASRSPAGPPVCDYTEPMDADSDNSKTADLEPSAANSKDAKPSSSKPNAPDSASSSGPSHPAPPSADQKQTVELKEDDVKKAEPDKAALKKRSSSDVKVEADSPKVEPKKLKEEIGPSARKPSRPSSTPPSNAVKEEKSSSSGLKRTLSEGYEKDEQAVKKEGKKMKMERPDELEAQLEVKITAKAGSHSKLEKIVQQLVEERMRAMELTVFDKHFQELKDRVDKIDCATKHQAAINTLQAKIARLAKKFGEANQASENKRKQEAIAAATAAANAAKTAAAAAAAANSSPVQRPVRTSIELKQTPTTVSTSTAVVQASPALAATVAASTPTTTAVVSQTPILQLITSSSNAGSTLASGITTQSPAGTLLLKTASGSGMMAAGQPLLIQLPLAMNGQPGTLVNIPVSSLSAASSLNKAKTTASTTTFILKPAPATTTAPATAPAATVVPALQASPSQVPSTQISLARAVYQGGTGGISTPNAGVSVTTARTPAQSVSVVGAMSAASSPAASGPAATGSTAPGPPQGTSLTSKTDNQASAASSSKAATPTARPKGSVIDLTEDDDDVQVTGVKNATVPNSSPILRPNTVVSMTNSSGAKSTPNQNSPNVPQLTVHHRPPLDSPLKSRTLGNAAGSRGSSVTLPPLPVAPVPTRLPQEAERTSPPQQPQLKLVPSPTGIVLSWCVAETDRTCAAVDSYHLYAYHQDNSSGGAAQQHWKKIGEVKALPLPMACTLTQFQSGSTYHFAVRAKDIFGRFGAFCEPQCTNVINSSSN